MRKTRDRQARIRLIRFSEIQYSLYFPAQTMTSEDTNAMLGASNPVHEPDPNADLSHPAASKQLTQPGVRPPKHFVKQWLAVQSARLPKQVAQPELQPLPAMQEVTQEPLPKHFVPQDVMSFCHCA